MAGTKKWNVIIPLIAITVITGAYLFFKNTLSRAVDKADKKNSSQSIAVLPFVNINNEPGLEYFSDGLTDGILNSIAHIKGLKVSARSSSFKFDGKVADVREVGRKLGVNSVLEGSFQLQGDRILITAQLINAENGVHFWSGQYDENINNIFSVQDRIALSIAKKLVVEFSKTSGQVPAKKQPVTKAAYELYLKGRSSWNLRTAPNLKKAIDFFHQAIAEDSLFAGAYSGIADCYTALGYGSFLSPTESFPKAFEAATKALDLDPALADPHATLGFYKFYYKWDWAEAEQEFRNAIALNPNYEIAFDYYGYYLTAMRRYDEARTIFSKARELDPLSVQINTDIGFSLYYSGDYNLAFAKLQTSLQMNPKFLLAHIWQGRTYQAKKMYPNAIAEYKTALEISANWPVALAAIGNVYGESGEKAAAQKVLDTLNALSSSRYVTSYGVALVYAGIGDKDRAFLWLNKAVEERSHWLVWLKSDPRWAPLQSDKRFTALINTVGLPN